VSNDSDYGHYEEIEDHELDEAEAEREEAAQEEWSEFLEWQRGLGAEPNFHS